MHPLSFVLVFFFLALLVVLGVVFTTLGTVKLRHQIRSGIGTRAAIMAVSWQSILATAGLLFVTYGIFGVYRIIWGA